MAAITTGPMLTAEVWHAALWRHHWQLSCQLTAVGSANAVEQRASRSRLPNLAPHADRTGRPSSEGAAYSLPFLSHWLQSCTAGSLKHILIPHL